MGEAFALIAAIFVLWIVFTLLFGGDKTNHYSRQPERRYGKVSQAAQVAALREQQEQEEESRYLARKERADNFKTSIEEWIYEKRYALASERKRLVARDAYRNENLRDWIGSPLLDPAMIKLQFLVGNNEWFEKGIPYFWYKVLLPGLSERGSPADQAEDFFREWENYILAYPTCTDQTEGGSFNRIIKKEDWYSFIATAVEDACLQVKGDKREQDVADLSGIDYEDYCAQILEDAGWEVETTAATGDQGVDLIAMIQDVRVCIQCKRYSKPVGNKAVQEVSAGVVHWNGTHGVVVSNAGFTRAAQKLAESTGVLLMSDLELEDLENRLQS